MTTLVDLVQHCGGRLATGVEAEVAIADVRLDSRSVGQGELFAALPGASTDGARFVREAIARGASAVLSPESLPEEALLDLQGRAVAHWIHPQARRVAGLAAAKVHGEPARHLLIAGVTGTNGKTTVAHLLGQLWEGAGRHPAVLGTVGNRLADGRWLAATHTTADSPSLHRLLAFHRRLGGDCAALELSSHALDQDRHAGLEIDLAIFTNLTRDHLDYHGDFERYAAAKERLFTSLSSSSCAIVRCDDPWSERMARAAHARGARVVRFGIGSRADLQASDVVLGPRGTQFFVHGMGISRTRVCLPLTGRHNVENALAVLAAVLLSGASPAYALRGLASVSPAPGRLESVPTGERGFEVLVDYAHTEDALRKVLESLRETLDSTARIEHKERGRLICVFGCGGDRDPGKRAPMGRVVNEIADVAVVTSDNPRSEDPQAIVDAILAGMRPARAQVQVELDRRRAIESALRSARPGDLVLIAGKGHEVTQWIGKEGWPFDDRKIAAEVLA